MPTLTRALAHLLTFCVAATAAVALGSSAAQAQDEQQFGCFDSCTFQDTKGDAPKRADIRNGRVENRPTSFFVKFRIKSLPKKGEFVVGAGLSGWGSNWRVTKTKHGISVVAWEISEVQVYPANPCPSAKITWNRKRDLIKAVLPHECSGSNAGGGSVINGIEFSSGKAKDSAGKVFYAP